MPGAGSLVAVRALNATQPKDGTVLATFNSGLLPQSVVQPETTNVDFRRYAWIGNVAPITGVCYGFGPKGVASWADLMNSKSFILGATGKGTVAYLNAATLRIAYGARIKQIVGFPGSADLRLALERGELDGDCGDYSSIPPEWLAEKKAHPFVRFTRQKSPEMSDSIQFVGDFAKTQEQNDLIDVLTAAGELGRPFIMSRDVPASRVEIMRKSFDATMKDPAFLAEMKKSQLLVAPLTGEESERPFAKITTVSPAIISKAREVFE
jgi:tripartite-type tricarboxylate transporter receptor subunit TctC